MNSTILNFQKSDDFYWRVLLCVAMVCSILIVSNDVYAGNNDANSNDIIGQTLCRLVQNLTGGIARAIATIAIFSVGVGLFMGKLNWGTAAATAAGVGIIFGSAQLVAWLSNNNENANCPTGA